MTTMFNPVTAQDILFDPYVHLMKFEFLRSETFFEINGAWPETDLMDDIEFVMGGRRGFGNHTIKVMPYFEELLKRNAVWNDLFREINSEDFCMHIVELLRPYAKDYGTLLDFDKIRFADRHPADRPNAGEHELFIDFDVAEAFKGYWREPHHDNPNKLIVFLLYLNEIDDSSDLGGHFLIYNHKDTKPYPDYERFPEVDDVTLHRSIEPEENLLVGTLNSKNSYHGVGEITSETVHRRFIYIAIGLKNGLQAWQLPGQS